MNKPQKIRTYCKTCNEFTLFSQKKENHICDTCNTSINPNDTYKVSDVAPERLYCFLHKGVFTVIANDPEIDCDEIVIPNFQDLWEKLPQKIGIGLSSAGDFYANKHSIGYAYIFNEPIINGNITYAAAKLWIKVRKSNEKVSDIWGSQSK